MDLGCGNGYVASKLAHMGFDVTAIDVSVDGIELARRAYPAIRFDVLSVYDEVAATSGTDFDVVVSSEVIEHLYFPRRLLQNAFEVLKPGGSLIVTTPFHGYLKNVALSMAGMWDEHHTALRDGGHIKFFSERTLTSLIRESGFAEPVFRNAGRVPWLWKSIVCRAIKPT